MANLTQVELQNLRHLIGAHETSYQKLNTYASQAVDPQIKQIFTKSAQDALNTKTKINVFFEQLILYLKNLFYIGGYFYGRKNNG